MTSTVRPPAQGPLGGDRHVVTVGVDGSAFSLAALQWAATDARLRSAVLRVVVACGVVPPEGLSEEPYPWHNEQLAEACDDLLDEALNAVELPEDVPVERVVRSGRPAHVLTELAADSDLLVVGARGRGGFGRLLMGSVSSRCVQQAKRPVVVVRTARDGTGSHPVVCGVDGSPASVDALRFAAEEARLRAAPLIAIHAVYWDLAGIDLIRPDARQLESWGRDLLPAVVKEAFSAGYDGERPVDMRIAHGHPAQVLVTESRTAALLVLGTQGRSAVEAALVGSVTNHCLQRARTAVAAVPSVSQEG